MADSTTSTISTLMSSAARYGVVINTPEMQISTNFAIMEAILNNKEGYDMESMLINLYELYKDTLQIASSSNSQLDFTSFCSTWRLSRIINLVTAHFKDIDGCLRYCENYKVYLDLFSVATSLLHEIFGNSMKFHYQLLFDDNCTHDLIMALFHLKCYSITDQFTTREFFRYRINIVITMQIIFEYCKPTVKIFELMKLNLESRYSDFQVMMEGFYLLVCNLYRVYPKLKIKSIKKILSIFNESLKVILHRFPNRLLRGSSYRDLKTIYDDIYANVRALQYHRITEKEYYAIEPPIIQAEEQFSNGRIQKLFCKRSATVGLFKTAYKRLMLVTKSLKC